MNAAKLQRRCVKPYFWTVTEVSGREAVIQAQGIQLRFARLRQTSFRLPVRRRLEARCPSKGARNCSNPLWSTGFFTRICPTNSGQCSMEHLSIVLSHQRKLAQERSCLT